MNRGIFIVRGENVLLLGEVVCPDEAALTSILIFFVDRVLISNFFRTSTAKTTSLPLSPRHHSKKSSNSRRRKTKRGALEIRSGTRSYKRSASSLSIAARFCSNDFPFNPRALRILPPELRELLLNRASDQKPSSVENQILAKCGAAQQYVVTVRWRRDGIRF